MNQSAKDEHRRPYVGEGEAGARDSAQMDREEVEGLDFFDERRPRLEVSAEAWDAQARDLMLKRVGSRPTLDQVRAFAGSEEWQAGLALLDLCPGLALNAARFTEWSDHGGRYVPTGDGEVQEVVFHPDPLMDWEAWAADVDDAGRGWSSSEWRLFELIAGITIRERKVSLEEVFSFGSWEREALAIVVEWATGGNQGVQPGRYTIAPRMPSL